MLKISNVSHVYPNGVRALDGVSLEVQPGMFGLLGPNGAGKSSLMRCIATLQVPSSGAIQFDSIDVLGNPEALRKTLGYLPQDFGVYPRVSAYHMLDHIAVLKGYAASSERREVVEALLNKVNLWNVRDKAVAGFSGGMRQRWGIAQALMGEPRLVIVDEPTAGLDPEESNRFLNLLAEVAESTVVILSTHIVEDISKLCQRTAMLMGGRIVKEGTPKELIEAVRGRIWRKTIDKWELDAHRAAHHVIATRLYGGRTFIHVLADTNPGDGFSAVDASLEDAYFSTLFSGRRAA
ncbi:MAG TPA: ABC transporter ATP-binding protein [Nevskiaceae bacterium]|nr:ABC transporter ATP-binding protein [Nevskiaceae bacterium]